MAIPLTTDDFKWPIHIVTDGTIPPLELESFQTEAVNKLKAHFAVEGNLIHLIENMVQAVNLL